MARLIHAITNALAHPWAIVLVPLACLAACLLLSEIALTLLLSILAISFSQLVLAEAKRGDEALHAKIDELIRAIDTADDSLIGKEREGC